MVNEGWTLLKSEVEQDCIRRMGYMFEVSRALIAFVHRVGTSRLRWVTSENVFEMFRKGHIMADVQNTRITKLNPRNPHELITHTVV